MYVVMYPLKTHLAHEFLAAQGCEHTHSVNFSTRVQSATFLVQLYLRYSSI